MNSTLVLWKGPQKRGSGAFPRPERNFIFQGWLPVLREGLPGALWGEVRSLSPVHHRKGPGGKCRGVSSGHRCFPAGTHPWRLLPRRKESGWSDCLRGFMGCAYLSSKCQGALGRTEKRTSLGVRLWCHTLCEHLHFHTCACPRRPQRLRVGAEKGREGAR